MTELAPEYKFRYWYSRHERMAYNIKIPFPFSEGGYPLPLQCTGLTDADGIDLYKADIIMFQHLASGAADASRAVIEFQRGGFYAVPLLAGATLTAPIPIGDFADMSDFWIIGNVYETPNLLE